MKKLLLLTTICCSISLYAQNYQLTFKGTGSAAVVESVKVENLAAGTSLTLNGGDILLLTGTVGISELETIQSSGIKVYPNPMSENSLIEFYPPVSGDAVISIYEISGRLAALNHFFLENSHQVFQLSGISGGYYLIRIEGNNYRLTGKLLSNRTTKGNFHP